MHVGSVLAVSPSSYCLTCFTICVVKFRDFPPRLGFVGHATEKPWSFDQQAETDECCLFKCSAFKQTVRDDGFTRRRLQISIWIRLP